MKRLKTVSCRKFVWWNRRFSSKRVNHYCISDSRDRQSRVDD